MECGWIVRLVLSNARDAACDTAVGRAFMRAAGAPVPEPGRGSVRLADPYAGAAECMAQRTGVRA